MLTPLLSIIFLRLCEIFWVMEGLHPPSNSLSLHTNHCSILLYSFRMCWCSVAASVLFRIVNVFACCCRSFLFVVFSFTYIFHGVIRIKYLKGNATCYGCTLNVLHIQNMHGYGHKKNESVCVCVIHCICQSMLVLGSNCWTLNPAESLLSSSSLNERDQGDSHDSFCCMYCW